jgi:hypothetical protein
MPEIKWEDGFGRQHSDKILSVFHFDGRLHAVVHTFGSFQVLRIDLSMGHMGGVLFGEPV